jgi:indole-3-glycerol phosphate synthase
MGVLDSILADKRNEIGKRRAAVPQAALEATCRRLPPARELEAALRRPSPGGVRLIAEVKKASPSRGTLNAALDPAAQARVYAGAGAAAISVLTDEKYFRGALGDLVAVRAAVDLPLLRKEFILDEYQLWESRAAGADAVLLIVAALDDARLRDLHHAAKGIGLATLVEVHTAAELDRAVALGAPVIGVNNRDLQTLETSLEPSLALLPRIPRAHTAVSESGIFTRDDVLRVVRAGAHAVLVGEGSCAPGCPGRVRSGAPRRRRCLASRFRITNADARRRWRRAPTRLGFTSPRECRASSTRSVVAIAAQLPLR